MRRVLLALAIAAATVFGAVDASAQVKLNIMVAPKILNGPVLKAPVIRMIPPSLALNRALMLAPNAQALGVKLKGGLYIVKLKQGNTVRQVHVDAISGDVSQ